MNEEKCPTCKGGTFAPNEVGTPQDERFTPEDCPECGGTGKVETLHEASKR